MKLPLRTCTFFYVPPSLLKGQIFLAFLCFILTQQLGQAQTCVQSLGNAQVLCYSPNSNGSTTVFLAEGNSIVQKVLDKNGAIISSTSAGTFAQDSVLVRNNQVIKKLVNGTIAYTKNIPPSVLSRAPSINTAVEMTDGTFVLGGYQKLIDPVYPPNNKDSLVLITTDANLNFQSSIVHARSSGPYTPQLDSLMQLIPLPNNQFLVTYYWGFVGIINRASFNFSTFQKTGSNISVIKSSSYGYREQNQPIITSVCGKNMILHGDISTYGQKSSFRGVGDALFNIDSLLPITSKTFGAGSLDYYGSYQTYSYFYRPLLRDTAYQISVNAFGDPRISMNDFSKLEVKFYNNNNTPSHSKIIPFVSFDHVIRTGDTTCLVLMTENGQLKVYNPDCNNVQNLPDLTLQNLSLPTPSVAQGQFLDWNIDIKNISTTAALGEFTGQIYISTDNILSPDDVPNGIFLRVTNAEGLSVLHLINHTAIPATLAAGNYYLIFKIDADNVIAESNENNNTIAAAFQVTASGQNANLKITNVTGQNTGEANGTLTVNITVKNNGTTASVPDSIKFVKWRSASNVYLYFVPTPYSNSRLYLPSIPAGQSLTVTGTFVLPSVLKTIIRYGDFLNLEPYFGIGKQLADAAPTIPLGYPGLTADSVPKASYYYPISYNKSADVRLTAAVLDSTYNKADPSVAYRFTLTNAGPQTAKNIFVSLTDAYRVRANYSFPLRLDSFKIISQTRIGSLVFQSNQMQGALEEDVIYSKYYKLDSLPAGQSVDVTVGANFYPPNYGSPDDYLNSGQFLFEPIQIAYGEYNDPNVANNVSDTLHFRYSAGGALPDLTLTNLTIPTPSVQQGQILNWKVDIKNIGTAAATANFNVKAYISKDNVLSADDVQDGIIPTGNFAVGLVQTQVAGASTVVSTIPAGQYYLILKVDADNAIVENDENNNLIVSVVPFTVTAIASLCYPKFDIAGVNITSCLPTTNTVQPTAYYNGTYQMYGSKIADGFTITVSNGNTQPRTTTLFAKLPPTTTPPIGSHFKPCTTESWLYFTLNGTGKTSFESYLDSNVFVRVHYWGAETNPESIFVEFDSLSMNSISRLPFYSFNKTLNCNPCFANDRIAATFNCPTTTVQFTGTDANGYINIDRLLSGTNVSATDNCGNNNLILGMKSLSNVKRGFVYPIHLVAYDSAGNKAVCDFNLRNICTVTSVTTQFANCPKDTIIAATNGQNCQIYSWVEPKIAVNTGEPVRISSNYSSGYCFPIGSTTVIYTASDSCGNTSTCTFNLTVTGGAPSSYCTSKGTAPWELWTRNVTFNTLNNTSEKYKDYATLGYSDYTSLTTTVTKGQTYPLSILPPVGWTGYFSNVYCRVWIDFNKNNTFEDSEKVLEGTNSNLFTTNVLVPTTAATGTVRMRVIMKQGGYPTACETFEKGEVEDYTITIQNGTVTCNPILKCPNDTTITIAATATNYCSTLTGSPTIDLTGCSFNISNLSNNRPVCFPIGTTPLVWTMNFSSGGFTQCTQNVTIIQQTASLPDLTLANVGLTDPAVQQGRFASFTVDIKNIGAAASSGNFTVKAYISSDQILDANDIQNGVIQVNTFAQSFPAGFTLPRVASATQIPATLSIGVYYLILKADADSQITESNEGNNLIVSASFTVTSSGSTVDNYCISKSNAPWEMWVSEVKFNTINNVSTQNQSGQGFGYTNFTNLNTSVTKGQTYPLSIQPGLSWTGHLPNAFCRVWIDFNKNNTFEANELVLEKTNANPLTTNVLIPTTAVTGSVRMRVSMKWGGYPTACEVFDKGEVEDYTINIGGSTIDACAPDVTPPVFANCPQNINLTTLPGNITTLAVWTAPTATDNCSTPTVTSNYQSGGTFFIGTTTVIYTAKDAQNNTTTCTFNINVASSTNTNADIALSLSSTPSVFSRYAPLNFIVSAKNNGNQAFTNIQIEFKFPTGTTNGGTAIPSLGTWQEWCAGGVQCFTWTIPTLALNANATLSVPIYVLTPTSPMVATAKLLASTPVDNVVANNTATISLNAAPPPAHSIQAQATQLIPIVVDKIAPNPSDGEVVVELESLDEREVVFDFSDTFGKTVKSETRKVEKGTNRVLFEVFELPQGIYFVSPSTDKGKNAPTKFVKM